MATDEHLSGTTERITIRDALTHLGVNGENLLYPAALYEKFLHPEQHAPVIGSDFFPSALLTNEERQKQMGAVDYATGIAQQEAYSTAALRTIVTITDMDAGLGTSLERGDYVASISHLAGRGIGSKGTDTHFHLSTLPRPVSVTEAKAHRYYYDATHFGSVVIQPLLNFESENAYRQFLAMQIPTIRRDNPPLTYAAFLNDPTHHISLAPPLMQPNLPTIDNTTRELTTDRTAPGGHGYLATTLLERLATNPPRVDTPHVRVITNGDGINNVASPAMVGFTAQERAGIVMVTTTRTPADVKGGILGLRQSPSGERYVDIMEQAQAGEDQKDVFQALGLTTHPAVAALGREHHLNQQYFNTNMALLNEGLLGEFLSVLRTTIGSDEFTRIITPDLIQNPKKVAGREFIQMEGALGSVLLRLNQYVTTNDAAKKLWAKLSGGSQFLRIINLDPQVRTDHFTPVKNAWDAWLLTGSDRFTLDTTTWQLTTPRPGHSITVNTEMLSSPFYKRLDAMHAAFNGTSVLDLDELTITGNPVLLPGLALRGKVVIRNHYSTPTAPFDLSKHLSQTVNEGILENVEISIATTGHVKQTHL